MSKEFLKPIDLATQLGVTPSRIYQLIRAGRIPAARIAGAIRIPRATWEEWVRRKGEEAIADVKPEEMKK